MKKSLARKVTRTGIIAAGFLLLAGGAAQAADLSTYGNYGAGNGNQAVAAWQSPIAVCGNSAVAGGGGNAWCDGVVSSQITGDQLNNLWTSQNYGLANGNQAAGTVQIPATGCGNAVALVANTGAGCTGRADADLGKRNIESAKAESGRSYDLVTWGNYGLGNGNQAAAIGQAPIAVCGNAAAGLGGANAGCDGTVHAVAKPGLTPNMYTSDNYGVLNGNQVGAGAQAPVTVCGNAIGVIATSNAGCKGDATAQAGSNHDEPKAAVKPAARPASMAKSAKSAVSSLAGVLG
ncbi:hypothetical protein Afil01_60360 [Actinorhabdospora filicis]|uniref:Chaplin domain-containing protein n=1 Tax=Actinorhabdospora filicis TaxID=1785913 RepID=A0A9W6WC28_9ACTN|nr:chaplin family protein [Actinorhabdospora filicis]GLZ81229.1 hypothetical protein Afil01_60360 [Actinorhabdospora filicis]